MTSEDEDTIQRQIRQAEETSQQEAEAWEVDNPPIKEGTPDGVVDEDAKKEEDVQTDTVGNGAAKPEPDGSDDLNTTNNDHNGHARTDQSRKAEAAESADHHGEEMVEGEEDTVIY